MLHTSQRESPHGVLERVTLPIPGGEDVALLSSYRISFLSCWVVLLHKIHVPNHHLHQNTWNWQNIKEQTISDPYCESQQAVSRHTLFSTNYFIEKINKKTVIPVFRKPETSHSDHFKKLISAVSLNTIYLNIQRYINNL